MTEDSPQSGLEKTILYKLGFERMMFYQEIERLRFAGATEKMIIEAYDEVTNPSSEYCANEVKKTLRGMKNIERDHKIFVEYYANPDLPSCELIGQKYNLSGVRVAQIKHKIGDSLGCWVKHNEEYERIRNSIKKSLYDRIMDKILEEQPDEALK